jgi:hypothetical protein
MVSVFLVAVAVAILLFILGLFILFNRWCHQHTLSQWFPRKILEKSLPRNISAETCSLVDFTYSFTFTWDEFRAYMTSAGVPISLLTSNDNCVHVTALHKVSLRLKPGVHISVDLEKRGRFMLLNGTFIVHGTSGETSFTIKNGKGIFDKDGTIVNAGAIRVRGGMLTIRGTSLIMQDCKANAAGGLYMWDGEINLIDNRAKQPGKLIAHRCRCTMRADPWEVENKSEAGGGVSLWSGTLNITSDDGVVLLDECRAGHHSGGMVVFGAVINFVGKNAMVHARKCSSGENGEPYSYGGGFVVVHGGGSNPRGRLNFSSAKSKVLAQECMSGGASGMAIMSCDINITPGTDPGVHLFAENCELVKYSGATQFQCGCSIYFHWAEAFPVTNPRQVIRASVVGQTCGSGFTNCCMGRATASWQKFEINGVIIDNTSITATCNVPG